MKPKLKVIADPKDIVELISEVKNLQIKRRLRVILRACTGEYTSDEIAELEGCSRASVTNWVRTYRKAKVFGLVSKYKGTREPALNPAVSADLIHHLQFGCIPGGIDGIRSWLRKTYKIDVSVSGMKYWYQRLEVASPKQGVPVHAQRNQPAHRSPPRQAIGVQG